MAYKPKTWQEKLADKEGLPKILLLEERFPCYNALHKMGVEAGDPVVLVNSSEVVAQMRQVAYGRLTTLVEICQRIACKGKRFFVENYRHCLFTDFSLNRGNCHDADC